jgi:2-polyprenyl-6-methoxyphenol hydroxylase-like FAD-dependent oxidoreductase
VLSLRIQFHFNTAVVDVDYDSPSPRIRVRAPGEGAEGRWVDTDLVIGADSVKRPVVRQRP